MHVVHARANDRIIEGRDVHPMRAVLHRSSIRALPEAARHSMRRLCVARLRARLLIFLVARQVFLEFVTLAATRIVHRAIPISLYWIGGRRILRVPVSVLFLVRILIGSHGGLLAARGAAPSAVRTSGRQLKEQRRCHRLLSQSDGPRLALIHARLL